MSAHTHSTGELRTTSLSTLDAVHISTRMNEEYLYAGMVQRQIWAIQEHCRRVCDVEDAVQDIADTCDDPYTYLLYPDRGVDTTRKVFGTMIRVQRNKYVACLRLPSFYTGSAMDTLHALQAMKPEYEAIILDLRYNGGGFVSEAEQVIRIFSASARYYVSTVCTLDADPEAVAFKGIQYDQDTPLFILVDQDTASASNIVAATLKVDNRATIVGEETHEKSWIQQPIAIGTTNIQLRFTINQAFTKVRQQFHPVGHIEPHYSVEDVLYGNGTKSAIFNAAYRKRYMY